jgi:hypothetical protein
MKGIHKYERLGSVEITGTDDIASLESFDVLVFPECRKT